MGSVFKKTATKPLPAGAKVIVRKGQRLAEWLDAKEKRRTAPVTVGKDGTDRIVITAKTYTAKYRDGSGWCRSRDWLPRRIGDSLFAHRLGTAGRESEGRGF